MAKRPKAKPKKKGQKSTDKEKSARFIETARMLNADETGQEFERAIKKLVPPQPRAERKRSAT